MIIKTILEGITIVDVQQCIVPFVKIKMISNLLKLPSGKKMFTITWCFSQY